jgi:hypothetical protein
MEVIEATQYAFFTDEKISNSCLGSTVEEVDYKELADENRSIATGASIRVRCRL